MVITEWTATRRGRPGEGETLLKLKTSCVINNLQVKNKVAEQPYTFRKTAMKNCLYTSYLTKFFT